MMMSTMPPFYTMEIMRFAAEQEALGCQIDHLEVGQPNMPAPLPVVEKAKAVLAQGPLQYCSALGVYELRQAIAHHYQVQYGLTISPESVVITPGASLGLYVALHMNFKRGDRVAIASPSYPCYRNVIHSLGLQLIEIPTQREDDYLITPALLADYAAGLDGILIASPNNPTGSMYSPSDLQVLASYCKTNGIQLLSDELYHGITYEAPAESILTYDPDAIIIGGFSKYFAMTGWRVGWIVIHEDEMSRYESLLQNMILCTSPLPQIAAIKALTCYELLDSYVQSYKRCRDVLYGALINSGYKNIYKPAGAFYIYLELDGVQVDSLAICKQLLLEEGVATSPGMDFSSNPKHCCLRLSFAQDEETIKRASRKLTAFLEKLNDNGHLHVA